MLTDLELKAKSIEYRETILRIIKQARAGHMGGDLSSVDILNVLYNGVLRVSPTTAADPDRDRYVQSKGHCVEVLYTVLAGPSCWSLPPRLCGARCARSWPLTSR